jgi:serine/threonine protein kinase/Tol biopolymer transport system component
MDPERWQRVAHIYQLTLEREPAERFTFLAEASADDPELRREVESLLKHESSPLLIDRPMLEVAAAVLAGDSDLEPGTQLGPYRIDALLGAGGMGQVYRAIDTRLNRTVAVKVLPKALATDKQFRTRFDREAQSLAALTHPHICTLHDIGSQNGVDFLVMEYLEGETLTRRLEKGPLPIDQALKYSIEITDALAAAHRHGIIHRDLKPGNIILTRSGAKLLDFGLAKPLAPASLAGASPMPTNPAGVTGQGTILGTVQYMAPEQLEGKDADARTDIFAFGAVVYEMLTGKKAFEGKTQAGLIGVILHAEPPAVATVQPLTPPSLNHIVKTCLAKDPDERWQSARDLCRELQWVGHDPAASAANGQRKREGLAWGLAILLGIGAVAVAVRPVSSPESNPQVARFDVAAPPGTSLLSWVTLSPEISPDGKRLVFMTVRGRERLLAIRSMDALEAQILVGTEGASFPFWSPDSRSVGFFADGKLKKMNVSDGPIQEVCAARTGLGGTWNRQGVIVFLSGDREGSCRVPAAGGQPTALTLSHDGGRFRHRPQFLPDGRRFLYFVEPDAVYLASLDGGEPKRILTNTSSMALYAPPGYLLFQQEHTIVAQRFDADLKNPLGDSMPVAQDVRRSWGSPDGGSLAPIGGALFSVSENGVLAYLKGPATDVWLLRWFDRAGQSLGTIGPFPFKTFLGARLSPDNTQIAMHSPALDTPNSEIWLFHLAQGHLTQLTFNAWSDRRPIWSPDGRRLVFSSLRREAPGLYIKSAGGEQPEELVLRSGSAVWHEHWPADWTSKGILLESGRDFESKDLWILPIDGDRKPYPIVQEPGTQARARLSPDGRWVAYVHMLDRTSIPDVYVRSLSTDAKWRISTAGGSFPRWGRNGKELFYRAGDGKLMAVPIEADGGALRPGAPQTLFQTGLSGIGGPGYNVSPDSQRFLIVTTDDQSPSSSIVVVSNWPAALKQ